MPIPDTPYTRKESYLNAIATGDSGGIPETPYTREEMYLDAIAKGGGGGGGGGGSSTLSGLTDVDISNPASNEQLRYSSVSHKWENAPPSTLYVRIIYDESTDTSTLSETWQTICDAIIEGMFVYISDSFEDQVFDMMAYQCMVRRAYHSTSEGTYKITTDGLSGDEFALYEYEAASANDYPVAL